MLGGGGNLDHFLTEDYEGFSLRLYDPGRDVWRIWWSSTARPGGWTRRSRGGSRRTARAGSSTSDVLEGVPIRMRFIWSEITGDSARWDQSFSFDDGATWVPNWTMLLTRAKLRRNQTVSRMSNARVFVR